MAKLSPLECHQCGNYLPDDMLGEASLKRCGRNLCWVCDHLKRAVARDAAIEEKTWATPVDA